MITGSDRIWGHSDSVQYSSNVAKLRFEDALHVEMHQHLEKTVIPRANSKPQASFASQTGIFAIRRIRIDQKKKVSAGWLSPLAPTIIS